MEMKSRWQTWKGRDGLKYQVRVDGVPSQAKLTLTRFNGNQVTVMDISVDDEEIYEIHSLLARWLYAHYGQDCDDLHKRHKERFGEHWYEEEERIIKEKYMKCKSRYQSLLTPRRKDEKSSDLVHDNDQKGGASYD